MAALNLAHRLSSASSPRAHPATYPGWWPGESFVLAPGTDPRAEGDLFYLRATNSGQGLLAAKDSPSGPEDMNSPQVWSSERLGELLDGLTLFSATNGSAGETLGEFLHTLGLEPMPARTAVLAVGSNACPAQILKKYAGTGVSFSIPSIRIRIRGYGVGFVPTISKYGYVPATLVENARLTSHLFLQFLDSEQLAVLDRSEGIDPHRSDEGDYVRAEILGLCDLLPEVDGDTAAEFRGLQARMYAYVSKIGALSCAGQAVLSDHDSFGVEQCSDSIKVHEQTADSIVSRNQEELVEILSHDNPSLGQTIRRSLNTGARVAPPKDVRRLFNNNRRSSGSWTARGPNEVPPPPPVWRRGKSNSEFSLLRIVQASGNGFRRDGESCVVLAAADFDYLGRPGQVMVTRSVDEVSGSDGERAIARAVCAGPNENALGEVQLDQVIRHAICTEVGESVAIEPLKVPWLRQQLMRRLLPAVFGRPNFVTARVMKSDITTMERDVALVTPLTLQMLGLDAGEFAVLEGVTPTGEHRSESVRVFPLDDRTLNRRAALHTLGESTETSDIPDSQRKKHELPPIFVDAALRSRLLGETGYRDNRTIRLRASLLEQVQKEMREFFLILLLSILTWVLASPDGNVSLSNTAVFALGGVVLLAATLLISRIRWRYKHTRPVRPAR